MSQPNVSRSIKELESQLKVKLFHISPKEVRPTSEATELYNKVVSALALIGSVEKNIKNFDEDSEGVIKIVSVTNFAGSYLAQYISEYNKKYPRIQFDIMIVQIDEALEMLKKNQIDFIFSTFPINYKGDFEKIILCKMKETGFASIEYAKNFGSKKIISYEQFEKLPYVAMRTQVPIKKPCAIVDSQEMMFQLVIKNFGVGFCGEEFLNLNHPNDEVFRFEIEGMESCERIFSCVYNKKYVSKMMKEFLQNLIKARVK